MSSNQTLYFGLIGGKICWSDKQQPVQQNIEESWWKWPAPFSCHARIELFLLNILDIFSGKNLMKKNIWHFIIFGKMNGPNQTPLPLTPGRLKVLPMGLYYIKACFYWKIGRASKTNSNKLCCVLPNLKPKVRPYNVHITKKYLIQRFLHTSRSFVSIGILILPML